MGVDNIPPPVAPEVEPVTSLEAAAMRYAQATADIRKLTGRLADCDEDGPALICSTPLIDPATRTSRACRKWTLEETGPEDAQWESARPRAEWCSGCVAIQEIVEQRRAAKRRRGAALSALSNLGRALLRRDEKSALAQARSVS